MTASPPLKDGADATDVGGASLTAQTLAGLRWTTFATVLSAALQVAFAAIMGRLLEPAAFGLVAASGIVLRFGQYFARMGVSEALVQKPKLTDEDMRAGFASGVGLGAAVLAVVLLAAPFAAGLLNEPDVVPVLRAMGLALVLVGAAGVSNALLRRELRFRDLAVRDLASYVVGYFGVGLTLALLGAGVWALVGAALSQALLALVLSYRAAPHPVRPTLHGPSYRALYGFGSRVSVIGFLEFLGSNLDTFAVGRYAGVAALGQYNRAYLLTSMPMYHAQTALSKVLFPGLSRIQADVARMRRAYLSAFGVAAVALVPVCVGMAVAAREIVLVVLGPQWEPAIAILPFLAAAVTLNMLNHFAGVTCQARGELNAKLRLQVAHVVALVGFLALAVGRGSAAYAAALAAAEFVRFVLYAALMRRAFDVRPFDLAVRLGPALLAAGAVAAAIALGRLALLGLGAPLPVVLVAEIVLGGVTLVAAFRLGPLRVVRDDLRARVEQAGVLSAAARSSPWARLVHVALGRADRTEGDQGGRTSTVRAHGMSATGAARGMSRRWRARLRSRTPSPALLAILGLGVLGTAAVLVPRVGALLPLALGAVVLGLGSVLLLDALIRRSALTAALVLAVAVVLTAFPALPPASFGPINVHVTDVLAALLLAAATARLLRFERLTAPQRLLLVFGVVAVISAARGVAVFGLEPALNQFRKVLIFTAAALYFSTVRPGREVYDRIARMWLWAAGALTALVLARWAALAAGLSGSGFLGGLLDSGTITPIRVVGSEETMLLLQAGVIALVAWRAGGTRVPRWLAPLLLAVVVLLQHRTVWVALLVGIAVMTLRDPRLRKRVAPLLLAVALAGAAVTVVVLDRAVGDATIGEELGSAATRTDTFAWRYEGWVALLTENGPEGTTGALLGAPFGTPWDRMVAGQLVDVSPHNFWLETYLRQGAVGFVAIAVAIALVVASFRAERVDRRGGLLPTGVLLVLLATQLTYSITYDFGVVQGMLLGLVLGAMTAPAAPLERRAASGRRALPGDQPAREARLPARRPVGALHATVGGSTRLAVVNGHRGSGRERRVSR